MVSSRENTMRLMKEFDDLIKGVPNLFNPGTNVIDAFSIALNYEEYVDFGGGVSAKGYLYGSSPVLTEEEQLALEIIEKIPLDGRKRVMMFCRFEPGAMMKEQVHPQIEDAHVLTGGIADRTSGGRWISGQVMHFNRMVKHEPFTPSGCLLFIIFTGV